MNIHKRKPKYEAIWILHDGEHYFTGQEFLDRFTKELDKQKLYGNNGHYMFDTNQVMRMARTAAGLSDEI